jgi:hypothetical protein
MTDLWEPIILDPPDLTPKQGWDECKRAVDECGGLTYPDGEVNWRAAFSADPGICTCPACHQQYWAWGRRQRCRACGFEYPTDWWPMYSYGSNAATSADRGSKVHIANSPTLRALHERRLAHPYYRYGFEHPVADPWKEHDKIDWRAAVGEVK